MLTAKITPLIRLPSSVDVFDYVVPEELKKVIQIGQIIVAPWRNKQALGVILGLAPTAPNPSSTFRARPIKSIFDKNPILTLAQIKLINKFSQYYFVTAGSVARLIVPDPLLRQPTAGVETRRDAFLPKKTNFKIEKFQLTKLEKFYVQIIKTKLPDHIIVQDMSSWLWFIIKLIEQKKYSSYLLLLPTIEWINIIASFLNKKYQKRLAVIHSNLSKGEYWRAYQNILNKKSDIILSTRQGVFLPIQRNSLIAFFDCVSQDFKQSDMHPRYDSRLVGPWTADVTDSQLIKFSSAPILKTKNDSPLLPASINQKTQIKLIDMKKEWQRPGNIGIISEQALQAAELAMKNKRKSIFITLRLSDKEEGVNINRIYNVLTKEVKNGKIIKLNEKIDISELPEIILTTPMALERLKLTYERGKIEILIFTSIEPILALQDYCAGERVFSRLKHWQMLAQELRIPMIYLQTYSSDNPAIKAFAYGEFENFRILELENRKSLNYPPFSQLIKLTYTGKNRKELDNVKNHLLNKFDETVKILGPYNDSLLLKILKPTDLSILTSLATDWAIDRDPENVL